MVLCLALVMVISMMAGCMDSEDISGDISALEKEETAAPAQTDATEEITEEATEQMTGEVTEEVTEAAGEDSLIGFGRMEGGNYTNTYAGFGCTLDTNWSFYTAEELQVLPENVLELYADTEIGEISDQYSNIYDMMAENVTESTSINVLYTKMGLQDRLTMATMSEDAIIDMVLGSKDAMIEAYTQVGMENINIQKATVTFLGEERPAIKTTCLLQGMDYYLVQVFDYSCGSYGITLTVSSLMDDMTQELLDLFYEV